MNLFQRILGCLAGLALGDALGGPTEFMSREQIKVEFGWVDHLQRSPLWHPHHVLQPGQVTDDTGQVLAVIRSLGPDGQTTAAEVARGLLSWAGETGALMEVITGPSTRKALERLRNGESPRLTGQSGTTNGAAYRGLIPGVMNFARPDRLLSQVVEVCLPTHGTTVAISGAAAVANAIACSFSNESSLDDILEAGQLGAQAGREFGTWAWGTPLDKRIELARRLVKENPEPQVALTFLSDYVGTDMLVAESVASVFGVIALADGDPMKAIQYGANLGGDTDTIAALAGAVCGAWKGISAIDQEMLAQVETVNHLNLAAVAERLVAMVEKGGSDDQ